MQKPRNLGPKFPLRPESSTSKDFYIVERILDKKLIDGEVKYKVKWLNYPMSQCTWEPKENLNNVELMLKYFDENFEKTKQRLQVFSDSSSSSESAPKKPFPPRKAPSREVPLTNPNAKESGNNAGEERERDREKEKERENDRKNANSNENRRFLRKKQTEQAIRTKSPEQGSSRRKRRAKKAIVLKYLSKIWKTMADLQRKLAFSSDWSEESDSENSLDSKFEPETRENDSKSAVSEEFKAQQKKRPGPGRPPKNRALATESTQKPEKPTKIGGHDPRVVGPIAMENNEKKPNSDKLQEKGPGFPEKSSLIQEKSSLFQEKLPGTQDKNLEKIAPNNNSVFIEKPSSLEEKPEKPQLTPTVSEEKPSIVEKVLPIQGDFEFGDKPKCIIQATPGSNDEVLCLVEWLARENGVVPRRSKIPNSVIKKHDPNILVNFYESKLRFNSGKSSKEGDGTEPKGSKSAGNIAEEGNNEERANLNNNKSMN